MTAKLAPCPFCGRPPKFAEHVGGSASVWCQPCGVCIDGDRPSDARAAWNRRADLGEMLAQAWRAADAARADLAAAIAERDALVAKLAGAVNGHTEAPRPKHAPGPDEYRFTPDGRTSCPPTEHTEAPGEPAKSVESHPVDAGKRLGVGLTLGGRARLASWLWYGSREFREGDLVRLRGVTPGAVEAFNRWEIERESDGATVPDVPPSLLVAEDCAMRGCVTSPDAKVAARIAERIEARGREVCETRRAAGCATLDREKRCHNCPADHYEEAASVVLDPDAWRVD